MKNITKLRKMSVEEFAKWLNDISQACFGCAGCPHCAFDKICNETLCESDKACQKGIELWLREKVKE